MKDTPIITPEDIFSGTTNYTRDHFKLDVMMLNKESLENIGNVDSLNDLIDKILEDFETNDEPEDFLKQFYQANYHSFAEAEECNVALIGYKYLNTSSFTYFLYLIYASVLNERYRNGLLTKAEFNKITKKYFSSFEEFNHEREIHKALVNVIEDS